MILKNTVRVEVTTAEGRKRRSACHTMLSDTSSKGDLVTMNVTFDPPLPAIKEGETLTIIDDKENVNLFEVVADGRPYFDVDIVSIDMGDPQ